MCGSWKYPYFPHRRDLEIPGGGGLSKAQKLNEWSLTGISREVEGSKGKFLRWGRYIWITFGTTQCNFFPSNGSPSSLLLSLFASFFWAQTCPMEMKMGLRLLGLRWGTCMCPPLCTHSLVMEKVTPGPSCSNIGSHYHYPADKLLSSG